MDKEGRSPLRILPQAPRISEVRTLSFPINEKAQAPSGNTTRWFEGVDQPMRSRRTEVLSGQNLGLVCRRRWIGGSPHRSDKVNGALRGEN